MIYVGSNPIIQFTTNKKYTKEPFECALTDKFNIILYSNHTAIHNKEIKSVAFVIPTHFPSFIRTFDDGINFIESVDKFFIFRNKEDRNLLFEFVKNIKNFSYKKITSLKIK